MLVTDDTLQSSYTDSSAAVGGLSSPPFTSLHLPPCSPNTDPHRSIRERNTAESLQKKFPKRVKKSDSFNRIWRKFEPQECLKFSADYKRVCVMGCSCYSSASDEFPVVLLAVPAVNIYTSRSLKRHSLLISRASSQKSGCLTALGLLLRGLFTGSHVGSMFIVNTSRTLSRYITTL